MKNEFRCNLGHMKKVNVEWKNTRNSKIRTTS